MALEEGGDGVMCPGGARVESVHISFGTMVGVLGLASCCFPYVPHIVDPFMAIVMLLGNPQNLCEQVTFVYLPCCSTMQNKSLAPCSVLKNE